MRGPGKSDTSYLLSFFLVVIAAGSLLLSLPISWAGSAAYPGRLRYVDALFTATSAVCVTGLTTVDTSSFTRFGQIVIIMLIQVGGLGIVSFTSMVLLVPGARLPFRRLKTIRSFSLDGVERDPVKILRDIVLFTLCIEAAGTVALWPAMTRAVPGDGLFAAAFHSISAFCNAGFSLFPDSLTRFSGQPGTLGVVSALIIVGGIGFIVMQDLVRRARRKKLALSYHSKLMLALTGILVVTGGAAFFALESSGVFKGMGFWQKAANALFQSITPRTAGFNAVSQAGLRVPSRVITMMLMFVGGAPGSIAGGIKIATAYLVALAVFRRPNERGEIDAMGRRIAPETIRAATSYFIKAVFLVVVSAGLVCAFEEARRADFGDVLFETVSAFGTVGLSLDFTAGMTVPSKLVIVMTMFSGRVGLVALEFFGGAWAPASIIHPEADILLG